MLINNSQVSAVLEQGGTVVVPSRQRAAAIRLAHTHAQLGKKLTQWQSCDVLPWSAWLERTAASARHSALRGRRRLGLTEEWLAWRAASVEASEGAGLLMPASLADALRQSAVRVRDSNLHWPGSPTSESALLARVMTLMTRTCEQRAALLSDDWTPLLRDAVMSPLPLLFAGFDEMGFALKQQLTQLGALFDEPTDAATAASAQVAPQLVAASDRADELRRAALWSRELLTRDPGARLLVIVPRLAQCRALVIQAFDHALNGAELMDGTAPGGRFAIEGGVPLSDYPLVGAALSLLALGHGGLEFPELAALLRGSFLGAGAPAARAALELRLRERNVLCADVPQLLALLSAAKVNGSDELLATLNALMPTALQERSVRQPADQWARAFAAQLAVWQWPGPRSLDSDEQQQRERFETLLGELAALGPTSGILTGVGAVELLRSLAVRTHFEPATDDAAVTISAQCGDPLVHYDGIWVAGLNAEHWPAPAQADPFIPVAVQRAAQLAEASAEGQLARALNRMAAWRARTDTLVYSWASTDDDIQLQPSSLLGALSAPAPTALDDPLITALQASAKLEARPRDAALIWPAERSLPRGTRALDLQATCPFRALAELRLDAAPLPDPKPGLDLRERGRLLHRALELVWRQLDGSVALRACEVGALQALAQRATSQAVAEILGARATELPPPLLANERARSASLIVALLEQEKARADFQIDALEVSSLHTLAGAQIRVRMDRVDRLADGRRTVIDYKSGAPQAFSAADERPEHVQLLIYAALIGAPLAGVVGIHLLPTGIRWRGAAADGSVFPELSTRRGTVVPWGEVLPYAQRVVDSLVRGFVAGEAEVLPGPKACERCHLAGLCRIDSARLALEETAPDTEAADHES